MLVPVSKMATETITKTETEAKPQSWLLTVDEKDIKSLPFKHSHKSFCLDISGSTQTLLGDVSTVEVEKKFCKALSHGPCSVIAWDTASRVCRNLDDHRIVPTGGTTPAIIFTDPTSQQEVKKSSIMILLTDGQIDDGSVLNMGHEVQRNNHIGLNICVLVCPKTATPGSLNVSVFHPLLTSNTLILFYDGTGDPQVLRASGNIAKTVPFTEVTEETKWADILTVTFDVLSNLLVPQLKAAPDGYTSIGDGRYVNLNTLLETKVDLTKLSDFPMAPTISIAKTMGKLPQLRTWLHGYEKIVADEEETILKEMPNSSIKKAQQLAQSIMHAGSDDEKIVLRNEYKIVRQDAELERIKFQKVAKERTRGSRGMIQTALQAIQEQEKAGYDMVSASLSNRAMRAGDVKEVTDEELENLDYKDCYEGDCNICLERKPLALLLRQHPKPEDNTTDWCLNFPLAHGYANNMIISPDVICVNCAQYFKQNGFDSVRVEVKGILPGVKLNIERNKNFCYRTLANSLVTGKKLPHVNMLFFATLDASHMKEWTKNNTGLLKYMQAELLQNTQTTQNFTAIGNKTNLATAMSEVLNFEEFMRQPLSACLLVLRTLVEFNLTLPLAGRKVLVKLAIQRCIRQLIESHLMNLKNGNLTYEIDRELFRTDYGVPIENTARLVNWHESKCLGQILGPDVHKMFMDQVSRFCKTFEINLTEFISPETFTTTMFIMMRTTKYDRVENTMHDLMGDKTFFNAYKEPADTLKEPLLKTMNQALFGRYPQESKEHSSTPPFVTIHGPSVLTCVCGKQFCDDAFEKKIPLKELVEHIRKERAQHFVKAYNGANPSPQSSHYSLHAVVSSLLKENPVKEVDRKTILSVLKEIYSTKGNRGNIYQERIIIDVIEAINSYLTLQTKEAMNKETHVPLETRVKMELMNLKVAITEDENAFVMLPSKLKMLKYDEIPAISKETLTELTVPLDNNEYKFVNNTQ